MTSTTTAPAAARPAAPAAGDPRPSDPQRGVLELPPTPGLPEADGPLTSAVTAAVPLLGAVGSVAVVVSTGHGSAQGWLMAGGILLASVAFAAATLWRAHAVRTHRLRRSRRTHARQLDEARATARAAARAQRERALTAHPDPRWPSAASAAGERLTDGDPLVLRYGVTSVPLALELRPGPTPAEQDPDPVAQHALDRFVDAHGHVGAVPAVVALGAGGLLQVDGPHEAAQGLVRAMVVGAASAHDARDLAVVVVAGPSRRPAWEWLVWLPHVQARLGDDADDGQLVVDAVDRLAEVVDRALDESAGRRRGAAVLVVVDPGADPGAHPGGDLVASTRNALACVPAARAVVVAPPVPSAAGRPGTAHLAPDLHLVVGAGGRVTLDAGPDGPVLAEPDRLTTAGAAAVARRLPRGTAVGTAAGAGDPVTSLLHLDDAGRLRPGGRRSDDDDLRVELGRSPDGTPVVLDLEEAARGGAGPHGLVIGATGSGKSELLRTLVLGLATGQDPARLNLLLVDFKGGATFAGLRALPHVSAVITNLADDLGLVDRMQDALEGELQRRQELLSAAGGFASRHDYEAARRAARHDLPALPRLLVVVDEFSELLTARPELVDLLTAVGRLGRSLGLHLLLASQRLEEGRLRGLDSHLSYRIALRTFSAAESRAVIGVADAHTLPARPGAGLLRTGPDAPVRFETTYVSGPLAASPLARRDRVPSAAGERPPRDRAAVTDLRLRPVALDDAPATPDPRDGSPEPVLGPSDPSHRTVLDAVVDGLRDAGPRARAVWLPPLDTSPTLGSLLPDLAVRPGLGLVSTAWRSRGRLALPLGLVDRPRQQRYDVLSVDLSGDAGHVAVVGGPRSGRSTALQSLVLGLALTRTPLEVQVHVLDFGGGALAALAGLPHVAGVAGRTQPDLVRRVVAHVRAVADAREAAAADPSDPGAPADVVLVVDQWAVLRADFPELEPVLLDLAQRGLSHGVHLVLSANRWADLRPALRDVVGTRLELRLGDPMDSEVDRRLAARVPTGRPGRALAASGHHAAVAIPDLTRSPSTESTEPTEPTEATEPLAALVAAVAAAWTGPAAPPVAVLPSTVALPQVRSGARSDDPRLLLGLGAHDLAPVGLTLDEDPHLLVVGESRSGRTTTLRTLLREVRRGRTPESLQVFLVDPRRTLLGELEERWCADQAATGADATRLATELVEALRPRLPGPAVTPAQLRTRSWWQGPEALVVVDDADLLGGPTGNALDPLAPLLPHGHDVGLHVVVARRSAGLTRRPDAVVTALRDLDQPVLQLRGDPADLPYGAVARALSGRPGHGHLVTRDGAVELQVARSD